MGDQAVFCSPVGVGQLVWIDGDVMFDLTANSTDQAVYVELAGKVTT